MIILYNRLDFAYIWSDRGHIYECTGEVGVEGVIVSSEENESNTIEVRRQFYLSKNFEQKRLDDFESVTVFIEDEGMSLDNLSVRYLVEDELRVLLIKTGNGFSDGGEIGEDGLSIFFYVKDYDLFVMQCNNYMHGKKIEDFSIELESSE